jgi:hypothetical protein
MDTMIQTNMDIAADTIITTTETTTGTSTSNNIHPLINPVVGPNHVLIYDTTLRGTSMFFFCKINVVI